MEKGFFFICALFVVLTGFNQQERVVEQGNADLLGRASVAVEAPKITQPLRHCSVNETGIATFIVKFTPSLCIVKWYKGMVELKKDDRINIYIRDGIATLVIDQVKKDDAGEYRVEISNSANQVESTAVLTVRPE